ncbi:MAG: YfhO family protein, partial [Bacteroidales bacterium]|nr:YfhO family protein [Bacteroidales bacterium]
VFGYKPKEFGLLLSKMIGFGILGLAINSVNIVRGFYKMFFSPRVSGSASYTDVLTSGVNTGIDYSSNFATSLLRFFSNDILGNGSNFNGWNNYLEAPAFYAGIISLMLIPQVFSFLNLKKKVIFASFLMFWLLIAFIPQLRYAFYLYMGDYYRVGLDFIIPFILILFSVFALKEIIKNQKINIVVLVLTAVSLIIILYFPYKSLPENAIDKNIRLLVSFLIITYSGLLILLSKKSFKKIAKISIVLLVIFELSVFSYNTAGKRKTYSKYEYDKTKFGYNDNTIASVKYLKSIDKSFYRIEKDYYSGIAQHGSLNGAKAQSYYGTASYSSFNQLNYIRFLEESGIIEKGNETQTRWSVGLRGRPLMYTFGNVKYHLSDKAEPEFLNFGFDSINSFGKVKVLKNRYFVPFGYTYEKFITADDFKKLKEFRKQVILLNAFVFEKEMFYDSLGVDFKELTIKDTNLIASSSKFNFELYKNYTDKLKEDTLQIKHFEQSKIIGEIDLKKTKLLFLTIPFDEGWKITDNGKKRKLSRVNFGFTGIILSKGKHELKLEYVPGYYYVSSIVSIFFMIFTLALIIFDMIRKKRLHKAEKL